MNALVHRHDLDGDHWTMEVALRVPSDAELPSGEPHPGRGETYDAEGRPYLLRSFSWSAESWLNDDGNPRDTEGDRAERRADALAQLEAENSAVVEPPAPQPSGSDVGESLA